MINTATLPKDISDQLSATSIRVMEILIDMIKGPGQKKNPARKYVTPSEIWIAKRIGRSRTEVSRKIRKLHDMGIIRAVRRRQIRGTWQTNLYQLGYWALRLMKFTQHAVSSLFSPCALQRTHSNEPTENSKKTVGNKDSYNKKQTEQDRVPGYEFEKLHPELRKAGRIYD